MQKAHPGIREGHERRSGSGLLISSPCDRVPLPKVEREEMRFLGPDEIARLADAIDERDRALVLPGAYGGLRAGEMFGLRRGKVDLLRSSVHVSEIAVEVRGHFFYGPPKTRAGRRSILLPRFVVDEFTTHCAGKEPGELVFAAPAGGTIRASQFRKRIWYPACIAAGLGTLTHMSRPQLSLTRPGPTQRNRARSRDSKPRIQPTRVLSPRD